jgi:hypothetical protein
MSFPIRQGNAGRTPRRFASVAWAIVRQGGSWPTSAMLISAATDTDAATATATATDADADIVAVSASDSGTDPVLNAGLLTHLRLFGGSGSASSARHGHLRSVNAVTVPSERRRPASRLQTSFERLGSAIALDILRIAEGNSDVVGMKNVKHGTSAGSAVGRSRRSKRFFGHKKAPRTMRGVQRLAPI